MEAECNRRSNYCSNDTGFVNKKDHPQVNSDLKTNESSHIKAKDTPWRAINALMAIFFAFAAFAQLNDPDSVIWIMLYLVPTLVCCTITIRPKLQEAWQFKLVCWMHGVICTSGFIYTLYKGLEAISNHRNNILAAEEAREAGGLSIVIAWLLMSLMTDQNKIQNMTYVCWLKILSLAVLPFLFITIWILTVNSSKEPVHCRGFIDKIKSYL